MYVPFRLREDGSTARRVGTLALYAPFSLLRSRLLPALAAFVRERTQLLTQVVVSDSATSLGALHGGRGDVAVVSASSIVGDLRSRELRPERYGLFVTRAWSGRDLADVLRYERIIDFDPTDDLSLRWLRRHQLEALANPARHFANNTETLADMVAAGLGYSVLSQEFVEHCTGRDELVSLAGDKLLEERLRVVWRRDPACDVPLEEFVEALT